jgi:hypothetical protein
MSESAAKRKGERDDGSYVKKVKAEEVSVKVEAKESRVKVEELPVKVEATERAQAKAEELPVKAEAEESTAQVKAELPVKTKEQAPRRQLSTRAVPMFAQPGTAQYEEQQARRLAAMKGKPSDDGVVYTLGDTRQLIGEL